MSYYRYVFRCPYCKKIYANDCPLISYAIPPFHTSLCPKCGEESGSFEKIVAKPKMFGLLGWKVKENYEEENR